MKLNLSRTAGLAAAVAVLAGGGLATAAVASTGSTTTVPALKPGQVTYVQDGWGDPKTELGVATVRPKGWTKVKLSTFEAKFTSPNNLWSLRMNGILSGNTLVSKAVADKRAALKGVTGYKLISQTNGTAESESPAYPGETFNFTTLVYSYTDGARGTRLVVERFVADYDTTHADFELSTGGRTQDRAGLEAITNKATSNYVRLP